MNVESLIGKLDNEKIGLIAGFLLGENAYEGNALGSIQEDVMNLLKQPHMPNFEHVIQDLTVGKLSGTFKGLAVAGVIGYLLGELSLHPTLNQVGRIAKNIGFNGAMGAAVASIFSHSTTYYSGRTPEHNYCSGSSGGKLIG